MYRNACQRGLLTIFFGGGTKPLSIWETCIKDGYVSRFLDQDIKSMVLEIGGTNISTTYMSCPPGKMVLGIAMPFLVMVVKNLKKYFSFEVTVLDDTKTRRRFRVSNFQSSTQILPLCTVMPIALSDGWNQIQFNLSEFTQRAYKKQFVEVQRVKINANIRIRRIYFAERLLPEDQLPPEYKLFMPLPSKGTKGKENLKPSTSVTVAPEQKAKSVHEIAPPGSKTTSVHSIKRTPSTEVKGSKQSIKAVGIGRSVQAVRSGEEVKIGEEQAVEQQAGEEGAVETAQGEEVGDEAKTEPASEPIEGEEIDGTSEAKATEEQADQGDQPVDQSVNQPAEQPPEAKPPEEAAAPAEY